MGWGGGGAGEGGGGVTLDFTKKFSVFLGYYKNPG